MRVGLKNTDNKMFKFKLRFQLHISRIFWIIYFMNLTLKLKQHKLIISKVATLNERKVEENPKRDSLKV